MWMLLIILIYTILSLVFDIEKILARSNVDNHPLPQKGFIDAGNREGVLNSHCIDVTIVQTKSLATVPFLLQGPHSMPLDSRWALFFPP